MGSGMNRGLWVCAPYSDDDITQHGGHTQVPGFPVPYCYHVSEIT